MEPISYVGLCMPFAQDHVIALAKHKALLIMKKYCHGEKEGLTLPNLDSLNSKTCRNEVGVQPTHTMESHILKGS